MKISLFQSLNDPFEWAAPAGAMARERAAFEKMKDEMSKDRGILCFSRSWHNPLLWSHYADKHRGICLGFELADDIANKVNYRRTRVPCDWIKFYADFDYRFLIMEQVLLTKFSHWRYENEIRAMVALDHSTERNGLYFYDFGKDMPLTEVIVGSVSSLSRNDIDQALGQNIAVKRRKARLAFRSFKVVEQRKASLWK
ncbi:MAG: DUF2971 domain-containing protein [Sphingomonadaceae bacterium]